ncbi:hypothetical protein VNO78_18167 [Psophocarpus tetragonolobus]|uniref:E3 ubiquitin protein ligase n=1 Tax=Psophocarpus tetragonolobus TaxID=3891 RepID=A0AAN9XLT4_PSOTE
MAVATELCRCLHLPLPDSVSPPSTPPPTFITMLLVKLIYPPRQNPNLQSHFNPLNSPKATMCLFSPPKSSTFRSRCVTTLSLCYFNARPKLVYTVLLIDYCFNPQVVGLRFSLHCLVICKGELDEIVAELEESRRKLVNLEMQKDAVIGINSPNADAVNGNLSAKNITNSNIVDANRLSELQDAQEDNQTLIKQFQELQAGSVHVIKWENELNLKLESADTARQVLDNSDPRIDELELQLQKCIVEKNDLEIKMEEAKQDTGREDIKSEFHVMASALSKEMGMMEAQLKRWKDAAHEAVSLSEKTDSPREVLSIKVFH